MFIYLFMAVLGLRFCARAFSSCGKWGLLFIAVRGPLSRPLLLRSTGSRRAGSVVVVHRPSCSVSCGIFPDQGSNPCPLHWQADSQPPCHQGSPSLSYFRSPSRAGMASEWFSWDKNLIMSPLYLKTLQWFPTAFSLILKYFFSSLIAIAKSLLANKLL